MQVEGTHPQTTTMTQPEPVSGSGKKILNRYMPFVYSVLGALAIWQVVAMFMPSQFALTTPLTTFGVLSEIVQEPETYWHIALTLYRLLVGFILAEILGLIIGTLMGLRRYLERALNLWIVIGLTIPSLVWAIVALMIFGLSEMAVISAIAITAFPIITVSIWGGVKAINTKLLDMAKVFKLSRSDTVLRVIFPQILPYIFSSSRYGIGICWKIAVVVEMLGTSNGVGYQLSYWFGMLSMGHVIAWTLILVIIMSAIEFGVIRIIESRVLAWRPEVSL